MKSILIISFLLVVGLNGFGQKCNNFKNLSDSLGILMFFQLDVIESNGLEKEVQTLFNDEKHSDSIIVWENLKENDVDIVEGDPTSLWMNKSTIEKTDNIRWIRIEQLYEKNNWIYFHLKVLDKKEGKTETVYTFKYKIRCDLINKSYNNKSSYKKIKTLK